MFYSSAHPLLSIAPLGANARGLTCRTDISAPNGALFILGVAINNSSPGDEGLLNSK
jgi:hypothetical protein